MAALLAITGHGFSVERGGNVADRSGDSAWKAGIARAQNAVVGQVRGTPEKDKKLRVVVFGAHPDDPESGCGGLIALLTEAGHEVIVAYATCFRGDRKIGGQPEGLVRRREATAACEILGARPHFFD
jgi:hypothetical protein